MLLDSKRPFYWISGLLILALAGIVIYSQYQKIADKNSVTIFTGIGPVKIKVEFAKTPEELQKGLMNRTSLDKNSGMLFIFPDEKIRSFWMKNTLIPFDIMFIDTNGRINEIATMNPCSPDIEACPAYTSRGPARFVIEVNAGFTARNHIVEGDILEISGF